MNLLVISASPRKESQSINIANYLANLAADANFNEIQVLDLAEHKLELWDGGSENQQSDAWKIIEPAVKQADAYILITPEWNGMASPSSKNLLMMLGAQDVAHKPVLLTCVSGGTNGVYPISELRMSGFKNNKMVPIPEHLIVRNVNDYLANEVNDEHPLHKRMLLSLDMLEQYANALKPVRTHYLNLDTHYGNGM